MSRREQAKEEVGKVLDTVSDRLKNCRDKDVGPIVLSGVAQMLGYIYIELAAIAENVNAQNK